MLSTGPVIFDDQNQRGPSLNCEHLSEGTPSPGWRHSLVLAPPATRLGSSHVAESRILSPVGIAVVTGGSRGVGRGVALALGDAGYDVYLTGRTRTGTRSVFATADDVTARGGRGFPCICDHDDDAQVAAVFERVRAEQRRLDILVNNVFAVPSGPFWKPPFWELPLEHWDGMQRIGLRSHYVASCLAAPLLMAAPRGLVANISSFGGAGYQLSVAYGVLKAGVDRLTRDMARDFRGHGVSTVSLWPGIVRTELVMDRAADLPFSTAETESPELTGRAIAALAADPNLPEKSGTVQVVAELAREYGFTDIDGTQPRSLRENAQ